GRGAVALMTGNLLMRGTKNKTRQQIQEESDRLKARVMARGGSNNATASVDTVEANLPGALRLAAELLKEPSFPESELEQARQSWIAGIERSRSDPNAIASRALQQHLNPFPKGDLRHVPTPDEELDDVRKVTLADIREFHQRFYGVSEGELVIAGQFDTA